MRARKAPFARNEIATDRGAKLGPGVPLGTEFRDLYSLFQLKLIATQCSRNNRETEAQSSHDLLASN